MSVSRGALITCAGASPTALARSHPHERDLTPSRRVHALDAHALGELFRHLALIEHHQPPVRRADARALSANPVMTLLPT
jgi:hypothetical protein